MRRNLTAVIFDMDGVLIDSHPAHRAAWKTFLQTLGRSVTDVELDFVLDGHKRSDILRHFLGELSDEQVRSFGECKDQLFWNAAGKVSCIPGALELLTLLKDENIPLGVATSASRSRCLHTLQKLQLLDKFTVIVTGSDVAVGKPDPSIYRLACDQLSSHPGNSVAIEDAASGIRAACAAGLACVGVAGAQRPESLRSSGATLVVDNLLGISIAQLELLISPLSPRTASAAAPSA